MISFVIFPSYFMLQRGGRSSRDGIIATCRRAGYGNVDQYLLHNLRENHQKLRAFYSLLTSYLSQTTAGNPWEFYAKYPALVQIQQNYSQRISDETLIQNWLLTRYAQEKGMLISDPLIVKRLQMITGGDISNQLLDEICLQLDLSDGYLTYLLREEMLAGYIRQSFFLSMIPTTPLDRWTLYQRIYRSLTAEVAVIPVELFQKEVKEPSEAELKKFFEENKNRVYNPNLPDSGFEIPTRFAFQIIDATPSEQLLASITREEIEKYYEENKATHFLRSTARPQGSQDQPASLPFDTLFPTVPGANRPGPLPGLDSLPGPGLNLDLETPVERPQESEGIDPTPAEQPSDPQSRLTNPAVYHSVAYRQEEEPTTEETPALNEEVPEETPKFDPNILYEPLEEVENTIRQILAYQKMDAAVKEIEKKMKEFYTAFTISKSKNMEPLDLATLAAEYHLNVITVETPLSVYELQQHECWRTAAYRSCLVKMFSENSAPYEVLIGRQTSQLSSPDGGPIESIGWATKKESRRIPEFTDEGMKELVRDRWLMVHARELAEKRAQELADLANQSKDQSLTVSLAGQDVAVVETGPFTWFTRSLAQAGYGRAPLVFGEVREAGVALGTADYNNVHIKAPGAGFMEAAYSLQPNESAVAMNQPKSLVFVIRLVESSPDEESLWQFFVKEKSDEYLGAGKGESLDAMRTQWIEEIERNVGFQWVNRPQSFQEREE
ncbi:MAG: hypothetical protein FWC43_11065 [Planctomycetaceae bacterium]|nr:hypothetical protein [Planctomycetaceae bacterium]